MASDGFSYPEDLRYTPEHEWVRPGEGPLRVGITDFAQDSLGDIVFISLPEVGADVTAGQACGEVESTKSVSDVYAPLSGTVRQRNPALEANPELVNSDPYGEGWLLEIEPADEGAAQGLLDVSGYRAAIDAGAGPAPAGS